MSSHLRAAVVALLTMAAIGCEESTSGAQREAEHSAPPTGGPPVECPACEELAEALVEVAQVECAVFAACSARLVEWLYEDVLGCTERAIAFRFWQATLPGSAPSADALRACSAALGDLSCHEFFAQGTVVRKCSFSGERSSGQPCLDHAQCRSGFCPSVDHGCATCAEPLGEGAPCVSSQECQPGLGCSADGSCARFASAGESCGSARPCENYHVCRDVCVALPRALGASCTPAEGCDARFGVACDVRNDRCIEYVPVASGASCGWGADQLLVCSNSGLCTAEGCEPAAGTGDVCNPEVGPVCRWPDRCVGGRCAALPEAATCD